MKDADTVFRELSELYEFYQEIAKFRIKRTDPGGKARPDERPAQAPGAAVTSARQERG